MSIGRTSISIWPGRGHNHGWTGGGEQVQPGGSKPARGRAGGKKHTNTNVQIQILKYKYINTNTQVQILKYKNTNRQIQIRKNTNENSKPARGEAGEKKYIKIIRKQLQEKQFGKKLDSVTNDNRKFYVSDSILLFDADLDFP